MTILHRLGHIADTAEGLARALGIERIIGSAPPAPVAGDGIAPWLAPVKTQVGSTCVWEWLTGGQYALCGVLGLPQVEASPLAGYYPTLAMEGRIGDDRGCSPADACQVARAIGFVPLAAWPRDPALLMVRPREDMLRVSVDNAAEIREHAITDIGEDRCEQIRQCLRAGKPVGVALRVDQAYEDLAGTADWHPAGDAIGGHMVLCTRWDRDGLWHRGSYGASFGLNGDVRVPWDVIADPSITGDVRALDRVGRMVA